MKTLEQIAEELARALGHRTDCEMIQCRCKCDCGSAAEQAGALENYEHFKRENKA